MATARARKTARVYRILSKESEQYEWCENCGCTGQKLTAGHSKKRRWMPISDDHPDNYLWFEVAWICLDCHMIFQKFAPIAETIAIRYLMELRGKWTYEFIEEF